MNRLLLQSLLIIFCFLFVYFWQRSPLTEFTVPLVGLLSACYVILSFKNKSLRGITADTRPTQLLSVFLILTTSLLLILSTGGLHSLLIFLLYFLAFHLAFLLEPTVVFVFCLSVIVFFFPEFQRENLLPDVVKLISLVLLSPLAYFFGQEIKRREKEKRHTMHAAERIIQDVSEIVKNEGKTLKEKDIELLKDIVDESRELEK